MYHYMQNEKKQTRMKYLYYIKCYIQKVGGGTHILPHSQPEALPHHCGEGDPSQGWYNGLLHWVTHSHSTVHTNVHTKVIPSHTTVPKTTLLPILGYMSQLVHPTSSASLCVHLCHVKYLLKYQYFKHFFYKHSVGIFWKRPCASHSKPIVAVHKAAFCWWLIIDCASLTSWKKHSLLIWTTIQN